MAGEIKEAILRANERKRAIIGGDRGGVNIDSFVTLLSGFDLDPSEIQEMVEAAAENGVRQMIETRVANVVLAALFVDGLATGLLIAEARDREKAAR